MTEIAHYHRPHLARAAEDNPNNARVPQSPGKGYSECLVWGWIVEKVHPHAGYRYYEITAAGKAALRAPKPARRANRRQTSGA